MEKLSQDRSSNPLALNGMDNHTLDKTSNYGLRTDYLLILSCGLPDKALYSGNTRKTVGISKSYVLSMHMWLGWAPVTQKEVCLLEKVIGFWWNFDWILVPYKNQSLSISRWIIWRFLLSSLSVYFQANTLILSVFVGVGRFWGERVPRRNQVDIFYLLFLSIIY